MTGGKLGVKKHDFSPFFWYDLVLTDDLLARYERGSRVVRGKLAASR